MSWDNLTQDQIPSAAELMDGTSAEPPTAPTPSLFQTQPSGGDVVAEWTRPPNTNHLEMTITFFANSGVVFIADKGPNTIEAEAPASVFSSGDSVTATTRFRAPEGGIFIRGSGTTPDNRMLSKSEVVAAVWSDPTGPSDSIPHKGAITSGAFGPDTESDHSAPLQYF